MTCNPSQPLKQTDLFCQARVFGSSSSLKEYEMKAKTGPNGSADNHVKEIKRKTRRQFSAEENIRIVLDVAGDRANR